MLDSSLSVKKEKMGNIEDALILLTVKCFFIQNQCPGGMYANLSSLIFSTLMQLHPLLGIDCSVRLQTHKTIDFTLKKD